MPSIWLADALFPLPDSHTPFSICPLRICQLWINYSNFVLWNKEPAFFDGKNKWKKVNSRFYCFGCKCSANDATSALKTAPYFLQEKLRKRGSRPSLPAKEKPPNCMKVKCAPKWNMARKRHRFPSSPNALIPFLATPVLSKKWSFSFGIGCVS